MALELTSEIFFPSQLGCDYCDGVRGVGIVNAVEILRAFPDVPGLQV